MILSAYFGRLPILLLFTSIALGTSAWCAGATSFESYLSARILNGFFSIVAQAVRLPEHLQKMCALILPSRAA